MIKFSWGFSEKLIWFFFKFISVLLGVLLKGLEINSICHLVLRCVPSKHLYLFCFSSSYTLKPLYNRKRNVHKIYCLVFYNFFFLFPNIKMVVVGRGKQTFEILQLRWGHLCIMRYYTHDIRPLRPKTYNEIWTRHELWTLSLIKI